jgi:tetratricopeptide (TPR) repeat protein
MRTRLRTILGLALALASAGSAAGARAGEPGEDRKRAAAAFDEGIALYKRAEFAAAARAFLEADAQRPSATAILNAIGAAKRAGDHLLAAKTAEKAIARGDAVVEARAALADAATRLARLELGCDATPCALRLDGEAASGASYVLPGTHQIEARGPGAATAEERLVAAAGDTYRIVLRPRAPAHQEVVAPPRRGLPVAAFFTGLGVTAVLTGITLWSGLDALAAKHALPASPTQAQEDDVLARARRTDYLLLGTGLAGVGTIVLGAWLTDWSRRPPSASAIPLSLSGVAATPLPGGAAISAGGRF